MKSKIETINCDTCGAVIVPPCTPIRYPVIFVTEQTEGRPVKPYISYQDLDLCNECRNIVLRIEANGAQGMNQYKLIGGIK